MEKRTVLIVDDAPQNLTLLTEILKGEYTVKAAPKGTIALKIALTKPDLILLDIVMPEMDGYEVCRRLKEDVVTRDIPVIFISGNDSSEERAQGLALGAVDFVPKPFEAGDVLKAVEKALYGEAKT